MEDLRDILIRYRDATLKIGYFLEKEDYDGLIRLLDEREEIINHIKTLDYNRQEFVKISREFQLIELQHKMDEAMNKRRTELKKAIDKIRTGKSANSTYYKKTYMDSMFFNKKI